MAIEWFCKIAGKEFGPLSAAELRAMVAEGSLTPNHAVRRGRDGAWAKAGQIKGLFNGADEADWDQPVDKAAPKPAEKPLLRAKPMPAAKPAPSHEVRPLHATPAAPAPPVVPPAPPGMPVGVPVGQVPAQPMPQPMPQAARPGMMPQPAPAYAYTPAPAAPGHKSSGAEEAAQLGKRRKKNNTLFVVGLCGVLLAAVVGIAAMAWPRGEDNAAKPVAKKTEKDKAADSDPFAVKKSDEPAESKPAEPAAETPPAEWKGEVKWVDAKEPIRRGDIQVRVTQVGQGKPVLLNEKNPSEKRAFRSPMLVVKLELANVGGSGKPVYKPWSHQYTGVILKDNAGRLIPASPPRRRGFVAEGQQTEAKTIVDEKIEDVLVFDLPKERFKHLRLLLSAAALGQQEPLGFEISPAMISEIESPRRPANDPDSLDPAGLGRTQEPKRGEPEKPGSSAPGDQGIPGVTAPKDPMTQLREAEAALDRENAGKKEE